MEPYDSDTDSIIDYPSERSLSPANEETFDSDKDYEYLISSEEVGYKDEIRHEVRWDAWKSRHDGTSNSWRKDWTPNTENFDASQKARREAAAAASPDIEIFTSSDIILERTHLRNQAYYEKLALHPLDQTLNAQLKALDMQTDRGTHNAVASAPSTRNRPEPPIDVDTDSDIEMTPARSPSSSPVPLKTEFLKSKGKMPAPSKPPSSKPHSLKRPHSAMTASSSTLTTASTSTWSPNSTRASSSTASSKATRVYPFSAPRHAPRSSSHIVISSSSEDELDQLPPSPRKVKASPRKPTVSPSKPKVTGAEALSLKWTLAARNDGAGSVTVVNEVDDEEIPPLPKDFKYLEKKYEYSFNQKHYPSGAWVQCGCLTCTAPKSCDCQLEGEQWEIRDKRNRLTYAYSSKKLFGFFFENDKCVIECNQYCSCGADCPNRVAQLARQIPIEIFKTRTTGWGGRSSVDVEKGTVLGIYTGRLMTREDAANVKEQGYTFALDWLENVDGDDDNDIPKYTVDSYTRGNWTRFLNHSCDPNLLVYSVVYDTMPDWNIPYIAFAARRRISAGEEFTFDYHPHTPKGKALEWPQGARQCLCATSKCCGWIFLD